MSSINPNVPGATYVPATSEVAPAAQTTETQTTSRPADTYGQSNNVSTLPPTVQALPTSDTSGTGNDAHLAIEALKLMFKGVQQKVEALKSALEGLSAKMKAGSEHLDRLTAQRDSVRAQLENPDLDDDARASLEGQLRGLNAQVESATVQLDNLKKGAASIIDELRRLIDEDLPKIQAQLKQTTENMKKSEESKEKQKELQEDLSKAIESFRKESIPAIIHKASLSMAAANNSLAGSANRVTIPGADVVAAEQESGAVQMKSGA